MSIKQLLAESTTANSSVQGRPHLVSLTRATTQLVYTGLVATQRTSQPTALLYGVKYLNENGDINGLTGSQFTGAITHSEQKKLKRFPAEDLYSKDELFVVNEEFVYKALVNNPFDGYQSDQILQATMANKIRIVCEAAETEYYEQGNLPDSTLKLDTWKAEVKTRKLKTDVSVEAAQDLEANGFDAVATIEDLLATQIAEDINKEIIQTMINVSSKFKVKGRTPNGILDLSQEKDSNYIGKQLYQYICEINGEIQNNTSFGGTWVLASARIAGLLSGSGYLRPEPAEVSHYGCSGILPNGLLLYVDPNAPIEYLIVGVKENYGDLEAISSLVYSPYTEGMDLDSEEHVGQFKVVTDPNSLQPRIMLLVRYALSVNPYTQRKDSTDRVNQDSIDQLTGRSLMSVILGIKLPEIEILQ